MIVMKFGGTSNEDAAAMRNVIRIVKAHAADQPIVVISAIARATNELEHAARLASHGNDEEAGGLISSLFERHYSIIDNLILSKERGLELEAVFFNHLNEIRGLLKGVSILRELTPRTMDAICSYGERLSSRIVAAALTESGMQSVWVDARDFMVTDENFGRAEPLMEVVEARLNKNVLPLVEEGKIPVTQGFIGITQSGSYTTMGRESSDYSAAIIGAGLNVKRVQIWTDVDGILTADPHIVKKTMKLKNLSFEEAFELSFFGAKVLHPSTMLPLIEKEIPVQILNSKRDSGEGTLVDVDPGYQEDQAVPSIKSIAYKKGLTVVAMQPHKRANQYLFWEGVFSVLSRYGLGVRMMTTSEYGLAFALDSNSLSDGLTHELERFGDVKTFSHRASLCIVGKGVRGASGFLDRIFSTISRMKVMLVAYGASELSVTFVIEEDAIREALVLLHDEFFEQIRGSDIFEEQAEE